MPYGANKRTHVLLAIFALCSAAVAEDAVNQLAAGSATSPGKGSESQPANWLEAGKTMPPAAAVAGSSATAPASQEMPWLIPYTKYGGDVWHRPALTGDWGGSRQQLMDKGMRFDMSLTQVVQRNVAGGTNYECNYQGGLDLTFHLDTGKANLWPGGMLKVKGEARYGRSNNASTGAMMPVNFGSLYPVPEEDRIELSEFSYTQFLAPFLGVTMGKFSPRETNVFAGDETEQFLNTAFNINPAYATTLPQAFLGAGLILIPHPDIMLTTLVLDSEGRADECGFDTAFDGGTSVFQQLQVTVKPCGLPGHQRLGWTWSDKTRVRLEQDTRDLVTDWIRFRLGRGPEPALDRAGSDWAVFYDFDQYLYVVPGSKDRGIGVFGRFGVTDGRVNPVGSFYSFGVGAKGLIPGRENDSFGVGYYYLDLSDKVGPVLRGLLDNNEQGVEAYYNIAVTPWLKVSPNIQAINPLRDGVDCTWVAGVRMKIDF